MNDRDLEILKMAIKDRQPFRIGQRGICIQFYFNGFKWSGAIPRADTLLYFMRLRITEDNMALSCETPGFNPMRILLDKYDKLTLL